MLNEPASSRIPVTPATHEALKEFRNGLNSSFDDAINFLLELVKREGEDHYAAGKRLRDELQKTKTS